MSGDPADGDGGAIPSPDPVARDYILLALRLDRSIPGLVDGYFGPPELKAQVDTEEPRPAGALRDDAAALRGRLAAEVAAPDRRRWLEAQLVALETQAAALAGEDLPYVEHVARCFDHAPVRRPEAAFAEGVVELAGLLPGTGALVDRLAAWDAALRISPDRLPAVVDWLVGLFRDRAGALFDLPAGETVRVGLVRDQPWSGYNWYDGGGRSRVELNIDLPIRAGDLLHVVAHETYPGHHLEHAWKEADLVARRERLEASILLINTPECLISEGLAELGVRFASPPADRPELLAELFERAGLDAAADPARARDTALRQVAISRVRALLDEVTDNAALMRHADGASHETVQAYLEETALMTPERAAKRLSFIEHPTWRTYVFVYTQGLELLERWLESVPRESQASRFGRLLHEQLTPRAIADATAGGSTSGQASVSAPSSMTNTVRSSPS